MPSRFPQCCTVAGLGWCMVCAEGWRVPSIRPLETLHNALTLHQVEVFIKNVAEMHNRMPPICVTPSSPSSGGHQQVHLRLHPDTLTVPMSSVDQPSGDLLIILLIDKRILRHCFNCG